MYGDVGEHGQRRELSSGTARGGKRGKLPPLSFWAVFPVRANPLRKFFRGYTPLIPPQLSSVRCPTNETSRENVLLDLQIYFFVSNIN